MRFLKTAASIAAAGLITVIAALGGGNAAQAESILLGWHVPWAAGGLVLGRDDATEHPREWPDMPVSAVRLWDTRTAWLHLEPGRDNYQWGALDAQLSAAEEHGVKNITLVLWGTPKWAATSLDPADAPWLGPGSASPVENLADWEQFVRMVAGKYKGRIQHYEIGNEPNLKMFWRGSDAQLVQMITRASLAIKEVDPSATVIAPAVTLSNTEDAKNLQPLLTALAGSGANFDAISFHWYPTPTTAGTLGEVIAALRKAASAAGVKQTRIWITEVGFQSEEGADREYLRTLPKITKDQAASGGVERLYWYAWTGDRIPGVFPVRPGSLLAEAIKNIT